MAQHIFITVMLILSIVGLIKTFKDSNGFSMIDEVEALEEEEECKDIAA